MRATVREGGRSYPVRRYPSCLSAARPARDRAFYVPRLLLGVETPRARNSECHSRHSFTHNAVQYHRRCCLSALCPRPSPLSAAPAPSPARRRRAHRRPPRASDALREGFGATHSWDIKDMVSLKKVSLSFSSDHGAHEVIVELVASWEV